MQHKVNVGLLIQACCQAAVYRDRDWQLRVIGWTGEELECESHIGPPARVLTLQRDTSTPKATEADAKEKTLTVDTEHFHPHTQDCSESSHALLRLLCILIYVLLLFS